MELYRLMEQLISQNLTIELLSMVGVFFFLLLIFEVEKSIEPFLLEYINKANKSGSNLLKFEFYFNSSGNEMCVSTFFSF